LQAVLQPVLAGRGIGDEGAAARRIGDGCACNKGEVLVEVEKDECRLKPRRERVELVDRA